MKKITEEEKNLIEAAKSLLDSKGVEYKEVYVYEGCTEQCGKMPRFIVDQATRNKLGDIPVCYHLDELKENLKDLPDKLSK
jgi:hypothetical protein